MLCEVVAAIKAVATAMGQAATAVGEIKAVAAGEGVER